MTKLSNTNTQEIERYFEIGRYGTDNDDRLSHETEFSGFIILGESALCKYASDEDWGTQIENVEDIENVEEENYEDEDNTEDESGE